MTAHFRLGIVAAGLALAAAPAFAQRPSSDSGTGGAPVHETAVARGSDSAPSAPSAAPSIMSSGTVSAPVNSPSMGAVMSTGAAGVAAPRREFAPQRRGESGRVSSGAPEQARPSPSAPSGASQPRGTAAVRGTAPANAGNENAVPSWSRPRRGGATTDTAVPRTGRRPGTGVYYPPYYYGYPYSGYLGGYYGDVYNPLFYYGNPYALGYGYGFGFGWPMIYDPWFDPMGQDLGYGGYYGVEPGGGTWTPYGSTSSSSDEDQGHMRLKVKPRDAKVYVDGVLVGDVDEMDGIFQKLPLAAGHHHIRVVAEGYQPDEFDVMIAPGQTSTFEGTLKKIK